MLILLDKRSCLCYIGVSSGKPEDFFIPINIKEGISMNFYQYLILNAKKPNFNYIINEVKFRASLLLCLINKKNVYIKTYCKVILAIAIIIVLPIGSNISNTTYTTNLKLNTNNPISILDGNNKKFQVEHGDSKYIASEKEKQLASQKPVKTAVITKAYNDPADFDSLYKAAGSQFGVPWQILKAVHYVETGCSGSTTKGSYAGARGPMQFMPGTWRAYGVDGNGDGVSDIYNVVDAIYGAAKLLAAGGAAEGNIDAALFNYNHAWSYVNKVKEVASSIN